MDQAFNLVHGDHGLRAVVLDSKPWFAAADVCRGVGLKGTSNGHGSIRYFNHTQTLRKSDRYLLTHTEAKRRGVSGEPLFERQSGNVSLVSEAGAHELILIAGRRAGRELVRWLVDEAMPAVRTAYGRECQPKATLPMSLPDCLRFLAGRMDPSMTPDDFLGRRSEA